MARLKPDQKVGPCHNHHIATNWNIYPDSEAATQESNTSATSVVRTINFSR